MSLEFAAPKAVALRSHALGDAAPSVAASHADVGRIFAEQQNFAASLESATQLRRISLRQGQMKFVVRNTGTGRPRPNVKDLQGSRI